MSIAEAQLINKVLKDRDYSLIENNYLTEEYFQQFRDEFLFLQGFFAKYKCIPDKETFSSKFIDFSYFAVEQNIESIVGELREQNLFQRAVSVINSSSELFEQDANKGVEYLLAHIDELQPTYNIPYTDIMHDTTRLQEWKAKQENPNSAYIPLPLPELEDILFGYQRGEELFLWIAMSGTGKTILLAMSVEKASKAGYRVAVISPELQTSTFSYRVDSSRTHLSNTAMQRGLILPGYAEYFQEVCASNEHIFVADSNDFGGVITVQQCKNFVKQTKADILFIDGLIYVRPDNWTPRMSMTDMLGDTGKQLLTFSSEAKIPIVAVAQANRDRTKLHDEEKISDATNVFGSYQLAQAATRIVSINRVASALKLCVVKNRYGRDTNSGSDGYLYNFDFDRMLFTYIPSLDDIVADKEQQEVADEARNKFKHIF